ncbi:unnamed protein product [Ilex paraguariensis]|uniref:Uncharacterized protein n=1 Tax=Ilex paraguariensis TaxID=185542 RepID=A0ABC8S9A9_9AQUA
MLSSDGEENSDRVGNKISSSTSKSSSASYSSSPPFSPSLPLHPNTRAKNIEEVWKDIKLAPLYDYLSKDVRPTTNFLGMIFQDFLAPPSSKEHPPSVPGYGSPALPTLSSVPESHFLGNSVPLRPNSILRSQPIPNICGNDVPAAMGSCLGLSANGKKRTESPLIGQGLESRNVSLFHLPYLRFLSKLLAKLDMLAYTNELELEIAHLMEENARLKKQQQQVDLRMYIRDALRISEANNPKSTCRSSFLRRASTFIYVAAGAQPTKKPSLHRTLTAPF